MMWERTRDERYETWDIRDMTLAQLQKIKC